MSKSIHNCNGCPSSNRAMRPKPKTLNQMLASPLVDERVGAINHLSCDVRRQEFYSLYGRVVKISTDRTDSGVSLEQEEISAFLNLIKVFSEVDVGRVAKDQFYSGALDSILNISSELMFYLFEKQFLIDGVFENYKELMLIYLSLDSVGALTRLSEYSFRLESVSNKSLDSYNSLYFQLTEEIDKIRSQGYSISGLMSDDGFTSNISKENPTEHLFTIKSFFNVQLRQFNIAFNRLNLRVCQISNILELIDLFSKIIVVVPIDIYPVFTARRLAMEDLKQRLTIRWTE